MKYGYMIAGDNGYKEDMAALTDLYKKGDLDKKTYKDLSRLLNMQLMNFITATNQGPQRTKQGRRDPLSVLRQRRIGEVIRQTIKQMHEVSEAAHESAKVESS